VHYIKSIFQNKKVIYECDVKCVTCVLSASLSLHNLILPTNIVTDLT